MIKKKECERGGWGRVFGSLKRKSGESDKIRKFDKGRIFGLFFAILFLITGFAGLINAENVYAEPENGVAGGVIENTGDNNTETADSTENSDNSTGVTGATENNDITEGAVNVTPAADTSGASCKDSLGPLGWLVCPATGKISEAVDFLYDKISDVLVINPVELKDGSPIYEIWKYFQGVTNIVFIIFLLIVVYSQITGVGITNYGVKKALPKLIIAALMVNLSFYICSLAVDVSNIFGNGLRGIFESIEMSIGTNGGGMEVTGAKMAGMYTAINGGAALAVAGGTIAFELGSVWMLIPLAFGALISVVIGIVTIAMRQAVVTLLIMVAPLAMVAYILPNTEQWFKKWRQLLFQMLVFYPAFSLLFGASSVAGWAIIVSAQNGFGIMLGIAVQIFPLFFSWSMMKMSGTFLSSINSKLTALTSGAQNGVRAWADSHRQLTRQKNLANPNAYMPSMRLQQYLNDRKVAREAGIKDAGELANKRGLAYAARRNYRRNGMLSHEGEAAYAGMTRKMKYEREVMRHENTFNNGIGGLGANKEQTARLEALDAEIVRESDQTKMEQARGEAIEYKNAKGYHERMEKAMNAHMDEEHGTLVDPETGRRVENTKYKRHFTPGTKEALEASARYRDLSNIMEGDVRDAQYAVAASAYSYDAQAKILANKTQKYMELTPPTKDVVYRLKEMTGTKDHDPKAIENIDAVIAGLRVINARGDTDLVQRTLDDILEQGVQLGSHASQSLASFLMFEVKDADPWQRRFGKYINLETARVYNSNDRKEMNVTYDEYIKGYHMELNPETGEMERMYAKKGMRELMEGTSLDNIERTALSNFDERIKKAYTETLPDGTKQLNVDEYLRKREEIQTAVGPQFISASLKYLSGSEQLVSSVQFLTGYSKKQKKEIYLDASGVEQSRVVIDAHGEPVYEWVASWDDNKEFASRKEQMQKYFERKTLQYLGDQTPVQIFGLRSDYKDPLFDHLFNAYMDADTGEWKPEYAEAHEKYLNEWADIQTRYGDLPPDEANRRREADKKELKNKMAAQQFQQILDAKGKLNQIYTTRRSGAANNAKDWVRYLLDLDNEVAISMKLENDRRKLKQEYKKNKQAKAADVATDGGVDAGTVYTPEDRAAFALQVDSLWHDLRDEDDEAFYNESLKYIDDTLGEGSFIAAQYKHFRKNDPYADSHMLKEYLEDLLSDPENY